MFWFQNTGKLFFAKLTPNGGGELRLEKHQIHPVKPRQMQKQETDCVEPNYLPFEGIIRADAVGQRLRVHIPRILDRPVGHSVCLRRGRCCGQSGRHLQSHTFKTPVE